MTSKLPPAPPDDDDRERKWIIEGLRQALARATVDELAHLTALLEPEADGDGNVAGWLVMLIADEIGRRHLDGEPDDLETGLAAESSNGNPAS
ncbi:MAG TPA: hypothetical protein VMC03_06545 [Streptosporangiaceae bacterium]|nr:hypothetical protein [Streptosporangiaceae bacterium]